jgi:hypothetical protein
MDFFWVLFGIRKARVGGLFDTPRINKVQNLRASQGVCSAKHHNEHDSML